MKNCVLIIGFGKSGKWAYNLALKLGYMPLIYDDEFMKLENCWLDYDVLDFAIVSPAILPTHELVQILNSKSIKIISEIEFAYLARGVKSPIVGVTGTNGKTTVVGMLGSVFGESAMVAGNIGKAWAEAIVNEDYDKKLTILELSSFQLQNISTFKPNIAILTNIAPDHLDYHGGFDNYVSAKMNILKNMGCGDKVVFWGDDKEIRNALKDYPKIRQYYFSLERQVGDGIYIDSFRRVVIVDGGVERTYFVLPNCSCFKKHELLNILAVCMACYLLGVNAEQVERGLSKFKPFDFRQTEVNNSLGIKIINDSKATNLASTLMAIDECSPSVLLVGGKSKKENYSALFKGERFKFLVVYGEMREEIEREAKVQSFKNIYGFLKFDDAVKHTIKLTKSGETLLFSPAGSSFDQFSSYKERGERFNQLIKELESVDS